MIKRSRHLRDRLCFIALPVFCLAASVARGQNPEPSAVKRPITVADGIDMTRLVSDGSGPNPKQVAHFSPDGKRFVLMLRRGNVKQNTNDFSLLLYRTGALHTSKPEPLLKMSSSSNRDAISRIRWLADNETLVFLGENPSEVPQVYSFNIGTRTLKKLTDHPVGISTYDITADGRTLAFAAEPSPAKISDNDDGHSREVIIEGQDLDRLLTGDYSLPKGLQVFYQLAGSRPRAVRVGPGYFPAWGDIFLSPDGRYILFPADLANDRVQPTWSAYRSEPLQQMLALVANAPKGVRSSLRQCLLFDSQDVSSAPLLNAPTFACGPPRWSEDGKTVYLSSYLPLDIADSAERDLREQSEYPVVVKLPRKEYRRITKEDFPLQRPQVQPVDVTVEQDINTPPKVFVAEPNSDKKTLLLDPNPQFGELQFGRVETIEWEVSGAKIIGGLYLPPDYQPGKQYPLVIQTHGFEPKEFSFDGRSEWSSAFAARPLAANGVLVLQAQNWKDREKDHDRIGNDRNLGATLQESHKNFSILVYEGAVEVLDKKGMIDRNRVGITGFSRTVCFVAYTLTHSKFRFAAASIVDGIGCGYFEEMAWPSGAWDTNALNGGPAPFGEGLKVWMKNSPGFNLDKVETPIRLVALSKSSVLGDLWAWYVGLSFQKKPVDFVLIPGAAHIYGKPSDCILKEQGLVDWFTFWLQGKENPNLAKADQYARWRELRKLQEKQVTGDRQR